MKFKLSAITVVIAALACAGAVFAASPRKGYYNYPEMLAKGTADLREFLKSNPNVHADSIREHALDNLSWSRIAGVKLQPASVKVLTPAEVYKKGKKSSLVFGKMDYSEQMKADTAYSNASAVALTADGICATNFHVIADPVLSGALDYAPKGDKLRFVMDENGNFFPLQSILRVDPINDLAIIKVDTRGKKLVPATIGGEVRPGDAVYCLANPSGAYFHFTDGMVSNCTERVHHKSGQRKYIIEITSDYGGGASGGPIYDDKGNLVALVSSTVSLYANPQQMRNFQMAYKQTVPAFLIKDSFGK